MTIRASQKVHGILHFTCFSRGGNEGFALLLVQGNPTDRDLHLIFECEMTPDAINFIRDCVLYVKPKVLCVHLKAFLKIPRCFNVVKTISFQETEK